MQVALSINARDYAAARDLALRAATIVPRGGMVHVDVCDGIYTSHVTWGDAFMWQKIAPAGIKTEVHLMARDWESRLAPWLEAGACRIIVQIGLAGPDEARRAQEVTARYGAELMLSVSLEEIIHHSAPYVGFTAFQILAVPVGISGQKFNELALERIRVLRHAVPGAILEVDGGVTPTVAARAKDAGADIVVSSSYIWGNDNPKEAYEKLSRI